MCVEQHELSSTVLGTDKGRVLKHTNQNHSSLWRGDTISPQTSPQQSHEHRKSGVACIQGCSWLLNRPHLPSLTFTSFFHGFLKCTDCWGFMLEPVVHSLGIYLIQFRVTNSLYQGLGWPCRVWMCYSLTLGGNNPSCHMLENVCATWQCNGVFLHLSNLFLGYFNVSALTNF